MNALVPRSRGRLLPIGLAVLAVLAAITVLRLVYGREPEPVMSAAQVQAAAGDDEGLSVITAHLVSLAKARGRGLDGLGPAARGLRATVVLETRFRALGGFNGVLAPADPDRPQPESGAELLASAAAAWQDMGCEALAVLLREAAAATAPAGRSACDRRWGGLQAEARTRRSAWVRERAEDLAAGR